MGTLLLFAAAGRKDRNVPGFPAEGATRPETLRQKNGDAWWALESGPARGPPKGRGTGLTGARSLRSQDRGAAGRSGLPPFLLLGFQDKKYMGLRTPLYDVHVAAGARMVDFGGWDMPVHYGSQIEEHHAVRRDARHVRRVAHVRRGPARRPRAATSCAACWPTTSPSSRSRARRSTRCMLNEHGGVIDDLIVYYLRRPWFRLVVNAGTRDKDLAWLRAHAGGFGVSVEPRCDLAMIAVQGPKAREQAARAARPGIAARRARARAISSAPRTSDWFVARTGYTGEDGFEIMLPAGRGAEFWARAARGRRRALRPRRARHAAARGRHEPLRQRHGRDHLAARVGPRLDVALEPPSATSSAARALDAQKAAGVPRKLVGLLLEDRGVLRAHQKVIVPASARARSPAAPFRRRWSARSRSRACPSADRRPLRGRDPRRAAARARS